MLEDDGKINLDKGLDLRSTEPNVSETNLSKQITNAQEAAPREDRRKGLAPVPDNLAEVLSAEQMRALRQIETFGWQLQFVRRPLSEDPLVIILSPNGDRYAALERDGRINLKRDLLVRKQTPVQKADEPISASASSAEKVRVSKHINTFTETSHSSIEAAINCILAGTGMQHH